MANVFFNSAKKKLWDGSIDLDTDTIKASLHSASYTPSADNHDFFDDVTNEVSSSGTYTAGAAGGITLANKAVTQDNTNDRAYFDSDDISITNFTGTFRYVVLRKDTGTAATSAVIAAFDLGSDQVLSNGTWSLTLPSTGWFYVS